MLSKFKNVYVLAPHTDDGELGAGGTIAKLIELGANIFILHFLLQQILFQKDSKRYFKTEVLNATKSFASQVKMLLSMIIVRKLNYSRQEILEDPMFIEKTNS